MVTFLKINEDKDLVSDMREAAPHLQSSKSSGCGFLPPRISAPNTMEAGGGHNVAQVLEEEATNHEFRIWQQTGKPRSLSGTEGK